MAITSAFLIVSIGVTAISVAVSNASKAVLANAAKTSEQAALERAKELQNLVGKKPTMTSAAVDVKSSAIYYGDSGTISNNINTVLQSQMPAVSLEPWAVANCAEFNAVNNALNAGAQVQNLVVTTVRVSDLTLQAMCSNCQLSIQGVLFVVSG